MSFSFPQQPAPTIRRVKDPLLHRVVGAGGDEDRFSRKTGETSDRRLVTLPHLRLELSLLQIPDGEVTLRTATHHHSFVVRPEAQSSPISWELGKIMF